MYSVGPSCFLSHFITKISNNLPNRPLWVSQKLKEVAMNVNWKALLSLGIAFWGLLCCTDLLGESTWKRCSHSLDDILKGQYNELSRMHQQIKPGDPPEAPKQKMNWPILLWNICAFLCSLVFCSVIRSMSWVVWKLFKIYNVFRNRKVFTSKLANAKLVENESPETDPVKANCKLIFKNQLYANAKQENVKQQDLNLSKELDELKKEKTDLAQQLVMAQKENLTARQQIEEYKLETFMMKEKLARTANTLKENLKYKDFANANQEIIARKAHNLELHLKEVSRDRDLLRSKLGSLEKGYSKLEERLKLYEKQDSETNLEQFPEKDTAKPSNNEVLYSQTSEVTETEVDICKFQKKIIELQRSIGTFEAKKMGFEANSKISVDLDESSLDTSKENDDEKVPQNRSETKKADINLVKQNILNYNAYKAQMLRPKMKLANIKERLYTPTDTTGSSSDDNSGPHRIISSTVEFQNFLKTLTSPNSKSSVNFKRSTMF